MLTVGSGCQLIGFCYWEVDGSWEGLPIRSGKKGSGLWVKPLIPVFGVARTEVLEDLWDGLHQRRMPQSS